MGVLQFPAPSNRRSNHIVEFCDDYSQENLPTYETEQQYANLLALKMDDTETQALPYNHSLKACSTLLPDFDEASSAIELIEEFDCKRYWDDISEVNVFPTDHGNYMRQSYKNLLHFNSIFDRKEQFDLCFTKLEEEEEEDCSSHGALGRNHGSYQADCILFNNCNFENFFRGQPTFSLLEWNDATAEQELPAPKRLVPKDLDQFTEPLYDDTFDRPHKIGSSRFSFFTEL